LNLAPPERFVTITAVFSEQVFGQLREPHHQLADSGARQGQVAFSGSARLCRPPGTLASNSPAPGG